MSNLTSATDEALMQLVSSRSEEALETLYDRYAPPVLGLLTRILDDRAVAEEILQETFWRVWERSADFDAARGTFAAWLYSIARRQAIDAIRRRKLRPQPARSEAEAAYVNSRSDPADGVDEAAFQAMERRRVREALAGLPPEQYRVIEMAYFQGLTRQQIAAATSQPLGTVHTRARLGLQRLRSLLSAGGSGPEDREE